MSSGLSCSCCTFLLPDLKPSPPRHGQGGKVIEEKERKTCDPVVVILVCVAAVVVAAGLVVQVNIANASTHTEAEAHFH